MLSPEEREALLAEAADRRRRAALREARRRMAVHVPTEELLAFYSIASAAFRPPSRVTRRPHDPRYLL